MCANGIITVGSLSPLRVYNARHFPTNFLRVAQTNIVAPFWNDHDLRDSSAYYKVYNASSGEAGAINSLEYVSSLISYQERDELRGSRFEGIWMLVAHWENVPPFPFLADLGRVRVHIHHVEIFIEYHYQ